MSESTETLDELARVDRQMVELRFDRFDEDTAWRLGADLRARATASGAAVTIEIRLSGATVFLCSMPGTSPANADWARRKRNVVELLHQPSYAVGLESRHTGRSTLAEMGLDARDYADHGGAVPIVVTGVGVVGVATVSGLPQRDDHELVVAAMTMMTDNCERVTGIEPA